MKVILLKDVPKVGKKNSIVEVKDGFALNSLFPRGFAKEASAKDVEELKKYLKNKESVERADQMRQKAEIEKILEKTFTIPVKSNDKGHLFSKFKKTDLVAFLEKQNVQIHSDYIEDVVLKETGSHEIHIKAPFISAKLQVILEGSK